MELEFKKHRSSSYGMNLINASMAMSRNVHLMILYAQHGKSMLGARGFYGAIKDYEGSLDFFIERLGINLESFQLPSSEDSKKDIVFSIAYSTSDILEEVRCTVFDDEAIDDSSLSVCIGSIKSDLEQLKSLMESDDG